MGIGRGKFARKEAGRGVQRGEGKEKPPRSPGGRVRFFQQGREKESQKGAAKSRPTNSSQSLKNP